jgi:hypothetical protein
MDIPGVEYLYTLSIISVTFASLSALVAAIRQIKGGRLSMADVHFVTGFVSAGFAQSLAAILPPAIGLFSLSDRALWAFASGGAALLFAVVVFRIQSEQHKLATQGLRSSVIAAFVGLWLSVLTLIANAIVPSVQGVGLHAAAITLSVATVMWFFVRLLASLGGESPTGDWDLRRG